MAEAICRDCALLDLGEVLRERLRLARGAVELDRRLLIVIDELAQAVDGHVHRVGDRAGDVLGDGGRRGQVALAEARDLVEQPQDRLLVALVLAPLRLDREALRAAPRRCADLSDRNSSASGTSADERDARRP